MDVQYHKQIQDEGRKSERFDPNQPLLFPDMNQPAGLEPAVAGANETAAEPQPAKQIKILNLMKLSIKST